MNRLLFAALLLAFALVPLQRVRGAAAGSGGLFINRLLPSPGAAPTGGGGGNGTANLVSEDAEGTGTPSGWTLDAGAANWDDTAAPAPLAGSQSLSMPAANNSIVTKSSLGNNPEVWGYMMIRFVTIADGGTTLLELLDSSGNPAFTVDLNGNLFRVYGDGGSPLVSTVATVSPDTTYHLWFHYKQGANAGEDISEIWFNTSATKPADGSNNHAKAATGTGQRTIDKIEILDAFGNSGSGKIVYDKIRLGNTGDLGSNPS